MRKSRIFISYVVSKSKLTAEGIGAQQPPRKNCFSLSAETHGFVMYNATVYYSLGGGFAAQTRIFSQREPLHMTLIIPVLTFRTRQMYRLVLCTFCLRPVHLSQEHWAHLFGGLQSPLSGARVFISIGLSVLLGFLGGE